MILNAVARFLAIMAIFTSVVSCAPVKKHETSNQPLDRELTAGIGDVIVRVELKEDLPNAFGNADLFGRRRDRGFSEVRYMGLADGMLLFRRRDVDISTNETTMISSGIGTAVVNTQPAGQGVVAYGTVTQPPAATVQALPPDTVQFAVNLSVTRTVTVQGYKVEIIDASPGSIRYIIRSRND